jgi:hypothetical protein
VENRALAIGWEPPLVPSVKNLNYIAQEWGLDIDLLGIERLKSIARGAVVADCEKMEPGLSERILYDDQATRERDSDEPVLFRADCKRPMYDPDILSAVASSSDGV